MKKDNNSFILKKLIKLLNLPISDLAINSELLIHPDNTSLLAISDILNTFQIENNAYRITPDELTGLSCPFVAQTDLPDSALVVVTEIDASNVVITSRKRQMQSMTFNEFKQSFKSIVLTVTKKETMPFHVGIRHWLTEHKMPLETTAILIVLFFAISNTSFFASLNTSEFLLMVIKTAGLAVSIILLIQSIDANNSIVQKLCKKGAKVDCGDILSSRAAIVIEGLTWSEVGFFYYAGTWALLLFGGNYNATWQLLLLANVMSLPYTFYSIYYQSRVAEKWCLLCCSIQLLLWLEFITQFIHLKFSTIELYSINFPIGFWSLCSLTLLLPAMLWLIAKPFLVEHQQLNDLKEQLQRFKFDTELFEKVTKSGAKLKQPEEEWSIVLGNPEASNILTVVTDPYCQSCARMHKLLHKLLTQNSLVQVRIIFTAINKDYDIATPVIRHLMALNESADRSIVFNALHNWYQQTKKDYETWSKNFPVELYKENFGKLDKQMEWCQSMGIEYTPLVLLNGYTLPSSYKLDELTYILE